MGKIQYLNPYEEWDYTKQARDDAALRTQALDIDANETGAEAFQQAQGEAQNNGILPRGGDTIGNGFFGSMKDAADAGWYNSWGGVATFAGEFTNNDWLKQKGKEFEQLAAYNTPTEELTGANYVAGAIGNAIGSMGAGMAQAAVVVGIGKALGLAAGATGVGANALRVIQSSKTYNALANATADMWASNYGKMLLAETAGSPFEAMAEAGNVISELREKGYDDDTIREAALKSAGYNMAWLTVANIIEGKVAGSVGRYALAQNMGRGAEAAAKATKYMGEGADRSFGNIARRTAVESLVGAGSEGMEEFGQNLIGNIAKGEELNYDEATEAAIQGAIGGAFLHGGQTAVNTALGDNTKQFKKDGKYYEAGDLYELNGQTLRDYSINGEEVGRQEFVDSSGIEEGEYGLGRKEYCRNVIEREIEALGDSKELASQKASLERILKSDNTERMWQATKAIYRKGPHFIEESPQENVQAEQDNIQPTEPLALPEGQTQEPIALGTNITPEEFRLGAGVPMGTKENPIIVDKNGNANKNYAGEARANRFEQLRRVNISDNVETLVDPVTSDRVVLTHNNDGTVNVNINGKDVGVAKNQDKAVELINKWRPKEGKGFTGNNSTVIQQPTSDNVTLSPEPTIETTIRPVDSITPATLDENNRVQYKGKWKKEEDFRNDMNSIAEVVKIHGGKTNGGKIDLNALRTEVNAKIRKKKGWSESTKQKFINDFNAAVTEANKIFKQNRATQNPTGNNNPTNNVNSVTSPTVAPNNTTTNNVAPNNVPQNNTNVASPTTNAATNEPSVAPTTSDGGIEIEIKAEPEPVKKHNFPKQVNGQDYQAPEQDAYYKDWLKKEKLTLDDIAWYGDHEIYAYPDGKIKVVKINVDEGIELGSKEFDNMDDAVKAIENDEIENKPSETPEPKPEPPKEPTPKPEPPKTPEPKPEPPKKNEVKSKPSEEEKAKEKHRKLIEALCKLAEKCGVKIHISDQELIDKMKAKKGVTNAFICTEETLKEYEIDREYLGSVIVVYDDGTPGATWGLSAQKNGELWLPESGARINTTVHEFTHLWDSVIQQQNKEFWNKIVAVLKKTSKWKEIEQDPIYSKQYGNNENEIADEVMAWLAGENAEKRFKELENSGTPKDVINKLKSALKAYWSKVKTFLQEELGIEIGEISEEELVNMPLADLLEGRINISQGGHQENVRIKDILNTTYDSFEDEKGRRPLLTIIKSLRKDIQPQFMSVYNELEELMQGYEAQGKDLDVEAAYKELIHDRIDKIFNRKPFDKLISAYEKFTEHYKYELAKIADKARKAKAKAEEEARKAEEAAKKKAEEEAKAKAEAERNALIEKLPTESLADYVITHKTNPDGELVKFLSEKCGLNGVDGIDPNMSWARVMEVLGTTKSVKRKDAICKAVSSKFKVNGLEWNNLDGYLDYVSGDALYFIEEKEPTPVKQDKVEAPEEKPVEENTTKEIPQKTLDLIYNSISSFKQSKNVNGLNLIRKLFKGWGLNDAQIEEANKMLDRAIEMYGKKEEVKESPVKVEPDSKVENKVEQETKDSDGENLTEGKEDAVEEVEKPEVKSENKDITEAEQWVLDEWKDVINTNDNVSVIGEPGEGRRLFYARAKEEGTQQYHTYFGWYSDKSDFLSDLGGNGYSVQSWQVIDAELVKAFSNFGEGWVSDFEQYAINTELPKTIQGCKLVSPADIFRQQIIGGKPFKAEYETPDGDKIYITVDSGDLAKGKLNVYKHGYYEVVDKNGDTLTFATSISKLKSNMKYALKHLAERKEKEKALKDAPAKSIIEQFNDEETSYAKKLELWQNHSAEIQEEVDVDVADLLGNAFAEILRDNETLNPKGYVVHYLDKQLAIFDIDAEKLYEAYNEQSEYQHDYDRIFEAFAVNEMFDRRYGATYTGDVPEDVKAFKKIFNETLGEENEEFNELSEFMINNLNDDGSYNVFGGQGPEDIVDTIMNAEEGEISSDEIRSAVKNMSDGDRETFFTNLKHSLISNNIDELDIVATNSVNKKGNIIYKTGNEDYSLTDQLNDMLSKIEEQLTSLGIPEEYSDYLLDINSRSAIWNNIKDNEGQSVDLDFIDAPNDLKFQSVGLNSLTANIEKLRKAKEKYQEQGKKMTPESQKEIYRETGWYKGIDGNWRYEIKDIPEAIKLQDIQDNVGKTVKVGDIYEHPELFEAYPELAKVDVDITNSKDSSLNKNKISLGIGNKDGIQKNLIHEIQHWIQEKEDFARGADNNAIKSLVNKLTSKKFAEELKDNEAVNKSQLLNAKEKLKAYTEQGNKEKIKIWERNVTYYEEQLAHIQKLKKQIPVLKRLIKNGTLNTKKNQQWVYENVAGEIEATNAEVKAFMSDEEIEDNIFTVINDNGQKAQYRVFDFTPNGISNKTNPTNTTVEERLAGATVTSEDKTLSEKAKDFKDSPMSYIKRLWKKFYIDWVDKNDYFKDFDKQLEKILGRKLKSYEKIYGRAQGIMSSANGAADILIGGLREDLAGLNKRFRNVKMKHPNGSMQQVLNNVKEETLDNASKEFMKKYNFKDSIQALGTVLTWRRLREMVRQVVAAHQQWEHDKKLMQPWQQKKDRYDSLIKDFEANGYVTVNGVRYESRHAIQARFSPGLSPLAQHHTDWLNAQREWNREHSKWLDKGRKGVDPAIALKQAWFEKCKQEGWNVTTAEPSTKLGDEPIYKLPNGLTEADLDKGIADIPKQFLKACDDYYAMNDNILCMLEDAGVISKELHNLLNTTYKEYCPLQRDFSDTQGLDEYLAGFSIGGSGPANVSNMIKEIGKEGSDKSVINPLETTIKVAMMAARRAERNKVCQRLVKLADIKGMENVVRKVEPVGYEKDGSPKYPPADLKYSTFTVMIDGKKVTYQTSPEFYQAIVGYDEPTSGIVWDTMSVFAQMLRTGSTMNPSFIVRNGFRDSFLAGYMTNVGFKPIISTIRGIQKLHTSDAKEQEINALFKAMGFGSETRKKDGNAVYKDLKAQVQDDKIDFLNPVSLVKAAWKMLGQLNEDVELGTRRELFGLAIEKGYAEYQAGNMTFEDLIQQAAEVARFGTTDFTRSGVKGQRLNQVAAFFNANVQGVDLYVQGLTNPETRARTSMMIAQSIMTPCFMIWYYNHDKPWWKELDPRIKYTNFCVSEDFRVPLPQEGGVMWGGGLMAALDRFADEDMKALPAHRSAAFANLAPNPMFTFLVPILEWQANYSFFKDRPIVNQRLAKLPDDMQYDNYTSELSKLIGHYSGLSPKKIDNTVPGFTGTLGKQLWELAGDAMLDTGIRPDKTVGERIFFKDFNITQAERNRYTNDFYELWNDANTLKNGDRINKNQAQAVKSLNAAQRVISKLNKEIRAIADPENRKISSADKRIAINQRRDKINRIAKEATDKYGKYFV